VRGTSRNGPVDWIEFNVPRDDEEVGWRVNLNFMLSNYQCIFGQGCPGHFGVQDQHTIPDIGCCSIGFRIFDQEDFDSVNLMIAELTDEDWDKELRQHVEKKGRWWKYLGTPPEKIRDQPEYNDNYDGNSLVVDGGCVFANRTGGSSGHPGCAFHVLAERTGRHHTETKPEVCWTAPIRYYYDEEDEVNVIDAWDADNWGGADKDETHDSWMRWWCMDTPDAYVGAEPVYVSLEHELRGNMGDAAYDEMVRLIKERSGNVVSPMPGAVRNDGRPMLPLLIGSRTPKR